MEIRAVELLWNQSKKELNNQVFLDLKDLVKAVLSKIEELREDTDLLISFFRKKRWLFLKTNSLINNSFINKLTTTLPEVRLLSDLIILHFFLYASLKALK